MGGEAKPGDLIPTTDRFGTALADIVRCRACGHMQLERFPSQTDLAEGYDEAVSEDYLDEEAGQRETARRVLAEIERHVEPGKLLDIGSWVGFALAEARKRGWETSGLEPSTFASTYAREQLGLDVRTADLLSVQLPVAGFQAILMGDVIEHLVDPADALRRGAAALAPEGVCCLLIPDAGSRLARLMGSRWWSVIPTHVQFFTRRSIGILLDRCGFEVLEIDTAPKAFTVRYYLDRIAGYSPAGARALVAAAEALRVADRLWAPDFRDRMLVIARPVAPRPAVAENAPRRPTALA